MNILSRQKIAALVAGTFIMAAAATPFIAQASDIQQAPAGQHQWNQQNYQMSPEQAAQRISSAYGIAQSTIAYYNANGMSLEDIGKAAFLATASERSLENILSYKTPDNQWKDIAATIGITQEQMQAAYKNSDANRSNEYFGLDRQNDKGIKMSPEQAAQRITSAYGISQATIAYYNANGMSLKDISKAAFLANASGRSLQNVISYKTTDNKWKDVSTTLGITKEQIQAAHKRTAANRSDKQFDQDRYNTAENDRTETEHGYDHKDKDQKDNSHKDHKGPKGNK
ncbi:MAG: hypothetical protein H7X79_07845 [Sporomusaceae bacterium]|nr:hypothetical protein [Sporomusaceae bacterium]